MAFLKRENRRKIFILINADGFFDKLMDNGQIMQFLESIWDLKSLPSKDKRFKDLEEDIRQYIINNNDWDIDMLFLEKLSILDTDRFRKFLEKTVDAQFHKEESYAKVLVDAINENLNKEKFELAISEYSEDGTPKYSVTQTAGTNISTDFPINTIPFFVDNDPNGHSDEISSHEKPMQYPAFVLVADNWNDFGIVSGYNLFYYKDRRLPKYVGCLKIICKKESTDKSYGKEETRDHLQGPFEVLTNKFCSLGQTQEYYENLKLLFYNSYKSILWSLQDCSIFPDIEENYSNQRSFTDSLLRNDEAEQILREEKYIIEGQDITSRYKFSYKFTPKYTTDTVTVDFKFSKDGLLPNRIYAIIGKNGVGKTQFITTLPIDIAYKNREVFSPHIPIFSKVIAVSNSYYDNFSIPNSTVSFNYVYCGLSKIANGKKEILTPSDLIERLKKSCEDIQKKERISSLKRILDKILSADIISLLFEYQKIDYNEQLVFQYSNIDHICDIISSGQSTLVYVFCNIVSNIRFDSLLLFDEPETHLHPNAITTLMTAIYELLEEYQSYSIISTHSPLIIRELLSRSVFIMERNDDYPSVKKIGLESFGENLTTLTEEIFGNKEVPKFYKGEIQKLIDRGYDYSEIIGLLETNNIPLSLNTTIYIKNLIESSINEKNK